MGYGKKSWLAVPAAVAGMLLFVGDDSYKVSITPGQGLETSDHLRSAGICCNVCVLPVRECKADRPSVGRRDGSAVYPDFCNFLLAVYGLLTGNTVNGSSGWVRLGSLSIQPGEFMKVLLILFSAFCYRARINKSLDNILYGVSFEQSSCL